MPTLPRTNPEWLRELGGAWVRLGAEGRSVLIGVSGGADSVAMLHGAAQLAAPLKMRVGAACVDHGLRSDSAREVELVRTLCDQLGVAFFTRRLELRDGADLEGRARAARYEALEALRASEGFDFIATAHTADDQAETVLMRLGRGASLRGLSAIRARNGNVLRPALNVRRAALRSHAVEQQLPFVDDPMNQDPRFLRVRVRRELLPPLEQIFAGGVDAVARFAAQAVEDEALLHDLSKAAFDRLLLEDGALDAAGVAALAPALRRRVLRLLLEEDGVAVDAELIHGLMQSIEEGAQHVLPGGHFLRSTSGAIRVVTRTSTERPPEQPLSPGAWLPHDPSGLEVGLDVDGGTWECAVASLPLRLDGVRPGDRMASGAKLSELLVDLKVPRESRAELPVLRAQDGRIVCVPGLLKAREAGEHRVSVRLLPGRAAPRWVGRYRVGE